MTTLGIGCGAMIAGLLGMNLKNFMEDWPQGFPFVTSLAVGTSIIVCGYGLARLKRIQKLTLYGRYPGVKKGLMSYGEEPRQLERKQWRDFDDQQGKWWRRIRGGRY